MRDKHQIIEEPDEAKVSRPVLKTSGTGDSLAEFNRSCQDAIGAIYIAINRKAKYVLDADIAKCFDRIDHEALLNKLNTFPTIRRQVRAWLKAGVMDNAQYFDTPEGTPQGGVISPLLSNIALHGMEERIKQYAETIDLKDNRGKQQSKKNKRESLSLIRYADDFVILHKDITVVQRCKEIISEWLKGIGLELKPSKTRIAHTLNQYGQEEPGFDFLGFNIRQFPVGKHHSKHGFKTIITPNKKGRKVHYDKLAKLIETHKAATQATLISRLNPLIRGWANYYATVVSKETYAEMDYLMYQKLEAWANHRHPHKGKGWVANKYWQSIDGDNWVFATRKENTLRLLKHSETPIVRHVKVKGESSPYDGNLVYWSTRMGDNPEIPIRVAKLLKRQKGKCTHCNLYFREEDVMEVDHKIPKSKGGKDCYDNWQLLHRHCHDTKTATDIEKAKAKQAETIERFERAKAIAKAYAQGESPKLRQYQSVDVPGNKSGCNSVEPKPTKRLEKVEDKWVTRYA